MLHLTILLAGTACGTGDGRAAGVGFAVRDSMGVTVVTNAQAERLLALREVLRVGVVEGDADYQFENILVGSNGALWEERADRHPRPALRAVAHQYGYIRHAWLPAWAGPRVFDVFDAEGRYQGTVELPDHLAPMAADGTRLYSVYYDELDVEYVLVHEVEAAAAGRS